MKLTLLVFVALVTACSSQKHFRGPSSICTSEKDCSRVQVKKGSFVLQSRNESGFEIWKDKKSGLIWSDRLPDNMSQYDAVKACENYATADKPKGSWRLPNIDQYKEANNNGIRQALPNMSYWFWSSSIHLNYLSEGAWVFRGDYGNAGADYCNSLGSVRCVVAPLTLDDKEY